MRPLKPSDMPDLTRILYETKAFSQPEIDCAVELLTIVLTDKQQQDYEVIVAEHQGAVAGYILFGPVPLTVGNYDIYWVATDPALHGQGVGRDLFIHTEQVLIDRGARMICLETSSQESYGRTRRFYLNAGYTEEARLIDFYRPGDDRLTYVKRFSLTQEV